MKKLKGVVLIKNNTTIPFPKKLHDVKNEEQWIFIALQNQ
jgi:hypothetical protein